MDNSLYLSQIISGLIVIVIGITFVFLFLFILILAIELMSRFVQKKNMHSTSNISSSIEKTSQQQKDAIAIAITIAHRKQN